MTRRLKCKVKRGIDVAGSLLILGAVSPLLAITSMLVYLSMGRPIFFRQPRIGWRGRIFRIYKFRTMTDAKDAAGNPLPDEQRLTTMGRFLRKTTLDEVPELINVLKGDMSLVGPRPLLVEYRDLYTEEEWRRHEMRPGMAGPVLAAGRNAPTWEEKFALDSWYVANWSLWLDFKILLLTALVVLKGEGINAKGHVTMPRFEGTKQIRGQAGAGK